MEAASALGASIAAASALAGGITIVFTVPQIVALSQASPSPLPTTTYMGAAARGIFARAIAMQTGLKVLHFGAVRAIKKGLDNVGAFGAYNINVAYGLVAVPAQAASYNTLTADTFRYFGKTKGQSSANFVEAGAAFFRTKVKPGFLWTFARDSNSVGGGLLLGPVVARFIADQRSGSGAGKNTPTRTDKLVGGTLAGFVCGCATQAFHNAALTAGRAAELGKPLSTIECATTLYKEHGINLLWKGVGNRVVVIAGMSAILNVFEPFK